MATTSVEKLDDTSVKLTVTIGASEVREALEGAARSLAGSVKVPGFRPGRVPRKVLESRLGKGAIMEEAVREVFPRYYAEALEEAEVAVVGPPRFEVEEFTDGKDGVFHATVDVRPEFDLPDVSGLEIEHPEWEVTDEEIDAHLDELRDRFAELETVERPADRGDYVVVTITGRKGDDVVDEASAEDLLYQIPEEETDSELDRNLLGKEAGAIVNFTDVLGPDYPDGLAGQELAFTAIVKEVKTKVLPGLDDDFAITASEFDTLEELREDLEAQMGREKRQVARANLRGKVVEAVAELIDIPLPQSMVEEEQRFRLNQFAAQAERMGLELEQFLAAVGTGPEELMGRIEEEARATVKAQLVVDAIGRDAEIAVDQRDLGEEIARQAQRLGQPVQELAEFMLQPERIGALYSDAFRRRTIDHLLTQVTVTGAPPEEEEPAAEDEAADEADADAEDGGPDAAGEEE